jgi:peptidyl-tRNA hydrolase, PTH1 family
MESLYLIVGLGNPGGEYAKTHHNAGYMAADKLVQRWQATWREEAGFEARVARARHAGREVMLCQPLTFMNLSGVAVRRIQDYFRVTPDRLLIMVDDADLPLGEIRLRPDGGSGGHHGLESVECHLSTAQYARLRLGIGRSNVAERQIKDYVLSRFRDEELGLLRAMLDRAVEQVECWLTAGIQIAMSRFNGLITLQEQRKAE